MKWHVKFVFATVIALIFWQNIMAQSQSQWPTPLVALYDCDLSGATFSSVSVGDSLSTISSRILRFLSEDASSGGVILMNLGSGDTSSNMAVVQTWPTVFTPDSTADHDVDYVISSSVTGTPGNYTISIFLQNSYTFQHAAEGTATFAAATDSGLNAAVETALSTILPLSTRIRAYELGLRNANQNISINPEVLVTASKPSIPANGSTAITITVLDCDSTPLAGQNGRPYFGGWISLSRICHDRPGRTCERDIPCRQPGYYWICHGESVESNYNHESTDYSRGIGSCRGRVARPELQMEAGL